MLRTSGLSALRKILTPFVFVLVSSGVSGQESFRQQLKDFDRDDIHSIHKRLFTKIGRHEVTAYAGGIFNNNGYVLTGLQYQYHFFESLGLEVGMGGYGFQFGDNDKLMFYQASLSFSPIYGKISWFTWAVLNFDLYTVAGAGIVSYSGKEKGSSAMGSVGIGTRVFITDFLSAKLEFRDLIYQRKFEPDSKILHNYALFAGISVLIPFQQSL